MPPPRQRSAAAVSTAWRVPPIPIARWSLVPRIAAEIDAVTVSVPDQLDARAGAAKLLDQVVVARSVENESGDVQRLTAEALRDMLDVLGDRPIEVDHAARSRPDRDRAHVHLGKTAQRPQARRQASPWRRRRHGRRRRDPRSGRARDRRARRRADRPARQQRLARPRSEHDLAVDRRSSRAAFIALAAASSAASSSARPSQRAPASAAHSVAFA